MAEVAERDEVRKLVVQRVSVEVMDFQHGHAVGLAASLAAVSVSPFGPVQKAFSAGLFLEPTPGLEPGTPSLRVKCSTS
jgi:hypothetical protein